MRTLPGPTPLWRDRTPRCDCTPLAPSSNPLLLRAWSSGQQHLHRLKAGLKCRFSGPAPGLPSQTLHFNRIPADSYTCKSSRSPAPTSLMSDVPADQLPPECEI